MDVKDLRTETAQSERNDGSKYTQSGGALPFNRNKSYQVIGSNPLAKTEPPPVRPCAVIGPDRVIPQPASNDNFLKKVSIDPWLSTDSIYRRPPEYPLKATINQNPSRNISPRQTFQENMQRIMVPPNYNAVRSNEDMNYSSVQDRNNAVSKNKACIVPEAKYCDVPYTINTLPNESKSIRDADIFVPSVNSASTKTPPSVWPPGSVNVHPHQLYQYSQYQSCAGPRPSIIPVSRQIRNIQEDSGYVYPEHYYQDPSIRFKPYPPVKDRYPQPRYEYISNYPINSYHPPLPIQPIKYDLPKSGQPHPYPVYPPHLKYIENRIAEHSLEGYQRPTNQQVNYNIPFRNQVIHPTYGHAAGNISQNKMHPYQPDPSAKVMHSNKVSYDNSNKMYIEFENSRNKTYPIADNYFVNEMSRIRPRKTQMVLPNYTCIGMPPNLSQQHYRKDNSQMRSYDYLPHFRNFESMNNNTTMHHPAQFSPNTLAISPDSNTSNETSQTQGTQEDCGYVSQSSTASARSFDSAMFKQHNEYYKRYDYRYSPVVGNSPKLSKSEVNSNENKHINVRQFLQMWNEGEDDNCDNTNSKENAIQTGSSEIKNYQKQQIDNQNQLYVLGLVNVPSEELCKYEHIQKISKLPENIKGYNSLELLSQFEEAIESSGKSGYKLPLKEYQIASKENIPRQLVEPLPRPVSPLDVEAKISQSVIHKDVGCNFEIKPCSPKMMNVEVAAPAPNILGERIIEKVTNPLSIITTSPNLLKTDENAQCHSLKIQEKNFTITGNPSCKMVGSPYATSNNMDSVKTNYGLHDLEINSGVCLASLPRLDNEIELNFPEVNQQFINANKIDAHSPTNVCSRSNLEGESGFTKTLEETVKCDNASSPAAVLDDSGKVFTKLIKYRKTKSNPICPPTTEMSPPANTIRTDSVIIKNPENIKNIEHKFIESSSNMPMNLTSQSVTSHKSIFDLPDKPNIINNNDVVALDFSLNKQINDLPIIPTEKDELTKSETAELSEIIPEVISEENNMHCYNINHEPIQELDNTVIQNTNIISVVEKEVTSFSRNFNGLKYVDSAVNDKHIKVDLHDQDFSSVLDKASSENSTCKDIGNIQFNNDTVNLRNEELCSECIDTCNAIDSITLNDQSNSKNCQDQGQVDIMTKDDIKSNEDKIGSDGMRKCNVSSSFILKDQNKNKKCRHHSLVDIVVEDNIKSDEDKVYVCNLKDNMMLSERSNSKNCQDRGDSMVKDNIKSDENKVGFESNDDNSIILKDQSDSKTCKDLDQVDVIVDANIKRNKGEVGSESINNICNVNESIILKIQSDSNCKDQDQVDIKADDSTKSDKDQMSSENIHNISSVEESIMLENQSDCRGQDEVDIMVQDNMKGDEDKVTSESIYNICTLDDSIILKDQSDSKTCGHQAQVDIMVDDNIKNDEDQVPFKSIHNICSVDESIMLNNQTDSKNCMDQDEVDIMVKDIVKGDQDKMLSESICNICHLNDNIMLKDQSDSKNCGHQDKLDIMVDDNIKTNEKRLGSESHHNILCNVHDSFMFNDQTRSKNCQDQVDIVNDNISEGQENDIMDFIDDIQAIPSTKNKIKEEEVVGYQLINQKINISNHKQQKNECDQAIDIQSENLIETDEITATLEKIFKDTSDDVSIFNSSYVISETLTPKPLKYHRCQSKELYSPWIQKLLLYNEGLCVLSETVSKKDCIENDSLKKIECIKEPKLTETCIAKIGLQEIEYYEKKDSMLNKTFNVVAISKDLVSQQLSKSLPDSVDCKPDVIKNITGYFIDNHTPETQLEEKESMSHSDNSLKIGNISKMCDSDYISLNSVNIIIGDDKINYSHRVKSSDNISNTLAETDALFNCDDNYIDYKTTLISDTNGTKEKVFDLDPGENVCTNMAPNNIHNSFLDGISHSNDIHNSESVKFNDILLQNASFLTNRDNSKKSGLSGKSQDIVSESVVNRAQEVSCPSKYASCKNTENCNQSVKNEENKNENKVLQTNTSKSPEASKLCDKEVDHNPNEILKSIHIDVSNTESGSTFFYSKSTEELENANDSSTNTGTDHAVHVSPVYPENIVESDIHDDHDLQLDDENTEDCSEIIRYDDLKNYRIPLKRSYSDSALNCCRTTDDSSKDDTENAPLAWLSKRQKLYELENSNQNVMTDNLCSIIHNNRRNSVSTFYTEEDVSFCILIDNNCIITDEDNDDKICYAEIEEDCITEINTMNEEHVNLNTTNEDEVISDAQEDKVNLLDSVLLHYDDEKSNQESWLDNVACVETVISDDITEDGIYSSNSTPTHIHEETIFDVSEIPACSINELMAEINAADGDNILGNVNLLEDKFNENGGNGGSCDDIESQKVLCRDECLEKILSEPNSKVSPFLTTDFNETRLLCNDSNQIIPENKENIIIDQISLEKDTISVEHNIIKSAIDFNEGLNIIETSCNMNTSRGISPSCESSTDNVFSHKLKDEDTHYTTSSSPEVSSTTSEEKGSSILLKITNCNGSRISQLNEINHNRPRCKFTEKKEYSNSIGGLPNRPLLTKGAQKYIPPIKESIRDLKVQLTLPQQKLLTLKQLKISKNQPKINNNTISTIPKKLKPNFDDVLMSIDKVQIKMHKEKSKKTKHVPKVVIKKNRNGSHYTSSSNKEFDPDLTGRKWQPWVFLEKNHFIDKMVIRNKTKAIFSHRQNTYVLAEKFKKYKSISSAKFVITHPNIGDSSRGQLKYTIRLKHTY